MFDPEDNCFEFFRGSVQGDLLEILTHEGEKKQVVGQSEIIPCILSRVIWRSRLQNRCCLHYIDNEAARCCLIKGYSPGRDNAFLASLFWAKEAVPMCFSWFGWVPSPSNISDPPSRGTCPSPLKVGNNEITCREREVPQEELIEWVHQWWALIKATQ